MQPTLAPATTKPPAQRLKKFIRQPDRLAARKLTDKGLEAMAIIERYRFIPSSLLVRLLKGGQRNNYRHLQTLFHKAYVNRFALPKYGGPGEFIYYLDSLHSLSLLTDAGLATLTDDDRTRRQEVIRYNRDKDYSQLHRDPDAQGKMLFIQHELMVSRFHAMLELACRSKTLAGKVELEQWKQGPELWNRVEVPKVRKEPGQELWTESHEKEHLPHRPDAFFTLHFPTTGSRSHFFYEADRGTENTTRFKLKLRAHFHFIVSQKLQRTAAPYNVPSIRAVLIESTDKAWASQLREAARHPVVSSKPSALFWFTDSEHFFSKPTTDTPAQPLYLQQPELVFKRIWQSPSDEKFLNLAD